MMKKLWLVILIISIVGFLTGISYLVYGIAQRGFSGVNYGRVIFPLIIGIAAFCLYKKRIK